MLPRIVSVNFPGGRRLSIQYDDASSVIYDLTNVIAKGNLATPLADDSFLHQVKITDRGRSLLWPNGLEFCADALRLQGEKQPTVKKPKRIASISH